MTDLKVYETKVKNFVKAANKGPLDLEQIDQVNNLMK